MGEPGEWAGGAPLGRGNVPRGWVVTCRSSVGLVRTELGWMLGCRGAGLTGCLAVRGDGADEGDRSRSNPGKEASEEASEEPTDIKQSEVVEEGEASVEKAVEGGDCEEDPNNTRLTPYLTPV